MRNRYKTKLHYSSILIRVSIQKYLSNIDLFRLEKYTVRNGEVPHLRRIGNQVRILYGPAAVYTCSRSFCHRKGRRPAKYL